MHEPIIYVVDDDESMRRSLKRLFASLGYQIEVFESPGQFLHAVRKEQVSCLVSDIRMQGMSGLGLQEELLKRQDCLPIIFLTGHATIPMSVQAVRSGALDFIEKPFDEQTLIDAVEKALQVSREALRRQRDNKEVIELYRQLTPREVEVFKLVAEGLMNREIAVELGISERTVKIHRARVMQKMQSESLAELVRLADRLNVAV